jgi:hypothetical protein
MTHAHNVIFELGYVGCPCVFERWTVSSVVLLRHTLMVGGSSKLYAKALYGIFEVCEQFMRIIWRYQSAFENP